MIDIIKHNEIFCLHDIRARVFSTQIWLCKCDFIWKEIAYVKRKV